MFRLLSLITGLTFFASAAFALESELEQAAAKLSASTVTVRISVPAEKNDFRIFNN